MAPSLRFAVSRQGVGRRAGATLVSEGFSSLQNFVILFAALHHLPLSGLGRFTLAYTAALLIEVVLKSLLLEPLMIRFSAANAEDQRLAAAHAVGACLSVGLVCSGIAAVIAVLLDEPVRSLILAVAIAVPALIVQEGWRVYFFAAGRPWRSAFNDVVCFGSTVLFVGLFLFRFDTVSAVGLLMLWGMGTAVGGVIGGLQARILPVVSQSWQWMKTHWALGSRLAAGISVEQISGRLALVVISVIAGNVALGRLSASRTVISPVVTLVTSAISFALPEAVRLHKRNDPRTSQFIVLFSFFLAGAVSLFGIGLYLIPSDAGQVVAGRNWQAAQSLLVPVVVWAAAAALRQGPRVGLRVFERSDVIMRLSAINGITILLGAGIGAYLAGAEGAAWAFAVMQVSGAMVWWGVYIAVARPIKRDYRRA